MTLWRPYAHFQSSTLKVAVYLRISSKLQNRHALVFRRLQLKLKNWPITNVNMVDREGFVRAAYAAALE